MAVTDQTNMMCQSSLHTSPATPSVWQMLSVWRTRRQLRSLDAKQLADIGVTAQDARKEANRPVWDVPATWRH